MSILIPNIQNLIFTFLHLIAFANCYVHISFAIAFIYMIPSIYLLLHFFRTRFLTSFHSLIWKNVLVLKIAYVSVFTNKPNAASSLRISRSQWTTMISVSIYTNLFRKKLLFQTKECSFNRSIQRVRNISFNRIPK